MKTKSLFFFAMMLCALSAFALPPVAPFVQDRVVDNAGLLSSGERLLLEKQINDIASIYNFDLVILTERNIGGADPGLYADRFFDDNGYGFGQNKDGSIFLQVTGSRDYWFSPSGRGINILNDAAYSKLRDDTVKNLSNDKPFEAYRAFIGNWEKFLELEAKGRRYNFFQRYNTVLLIVVWVLSYIIASAITAVWKSKMNTALAQNQADAYTVPGSLVYTVRTDRFLYSTITKRENQQSSSGGFSGGSGRGRGGKY